MKFNRSIDRLCLSFSLAVSAIACGQLAVQAETTNPVSEAPMLQMADTIRLTSNLILPEAASFSNAAVAPQETTAVLSAALEPTASVANQPANLSAQSVNVPQVETAVSSTAATTLAVPAPGTVPTSAAALDLEASTSAFAEQQDFAQTTAPVLAQIEPIEPGRATRSGSSYVGVGANIGAIGSTPLGDLSGAILSKIGLTSNISVRPTILINGDVSFLFPVTLDFPIQSAGRVSFAPYVGVGASFSTGDRKNADLIVSGGVDVPLSPQLTLTAAANAGLIDGIELGVLIGIGYNFAGF
ncbi:hypothetical protein H6F76_16810 [Leptolyngbya sp. FACHB-321]|uniref:hypothetical protein n=1 Tax=Leptolyngbya sp. FACHB-321 TaxID=2692807 RepID=UPI001687EC7A|nr:hypothetical protein [Leptolyngbya sp. FACHB-321]MBD2036672.1 hypothetical protein [Leptolyngbya sp. FACHB-321]